MINQDEHSLCKRAEEKTPGPLPESSPLLVHELKVHQIELEMQNEELRDTQAELIAARIRYFDLYDLAPVGYLTVNLQGIILEANLTFANLVGLDRRLLSKQALSKFILSSDQDIYYKHQKSLSETGLPQTCELRMKRNDGSIFWARLASTQVRNGCGMPVCRVVVCDSTVSKMSEEALAESEARYRALMEQPPEAVMICDPETGEIIEVNSKFFDYFGYTLEGDKPLTLFEIIVDSEENIKANRDIGKNTGVLPLQRRIFRHRNGTLVTVERAGTLVRYRGRSLLMMTLRNVTDEVRREQELVHDAQLATRVQKALLSPVEESDFLDIATIYEPYSFVGGDLYFMDWRYQDQVLRGYLVDATGHGLSTALHTSAIHVLLREINELDLPLQEQMCVLNQRAFQYFEEGNFMGALAFEIDLPMQKLHWVCAGIPTILVSTQTVRGTVARSGMYLGLERHETFEVHQIPFETEDSFYFLTDGITDRVGTGADLPLENYTKTVSMLQSIAKAPDRRDDAMAVCIHIKALPQASIRKEGWPRALRFDSFGDYQRFKDEISNILTEVTEKKHSLLEVAVNEALANAMECRDGKPRRHWAQLRFNRIGRLFTVRVKTSRLGFAGNALLRRLKANPQEMFAFGEDQAMGRGIPIMLSLADKMVYNSEGTEILLAWKIG